MQEKSISWFPPICARLGIVCSQTSDQTCNTGMCANWNPTATTCLWNGAPTKPCQQGLLFQVLQSSESSPCMCGSELIQNFSVKFIQNFDVSLLHFFLFWKFLLTLSFGSSNSVLQFTEQVGSKFLCDFMQPWTTKTGEYPLEKTHKTQFLLITLSQYRCQLLSCFYLLLAVF